MAKSIWLIDSFSKQQKALFRIKMLGKTKFNSIADEQRHSNSV